MHTKEQLVRDLAALDVQPGDAIFMHSSYKSLGGIEGGAAGFFEAFLEWLGNEGTLVLPAFSYDTVTRANPYFDVRTTPSCVGYLPEFFRTQVPGVIRSVHPTHSCCAAGKNAAFLTELHHLDRTPVGARSPLTRLAQLGGKILMLGCSPDRNTTMHGVEETCETEYYFDRNAPTVFSLTDAEGRTVQVTHLVAGFHLPHATYHQRYSRILGLLSENEVWYGKVLDADCVLMDSQAVWRKGNAMLRKDPLYFVDVEPK